MLDRLHADDKTPKKEVEEKEDMNRKGGKLVSRIPTFQKRTVSPSQNTEVPVPKKDAPGSVAQSPETVASVDPLKSKPPEVRETALHQPSVRIPKMSFEVPSVFSSGEEAVVTGHTPAVPGSFSASESALYPLMAVSPRPALRTEQDMSKSSEAEADTIPEAPATYLLHDSALKQKPQVDTEISVTGSGDDGSSVGSVPTAEVSPVEAIMDEEPPWETEPTKTDESKDSRSSSDAESEDGLSGDKSEGHDSEQVEEHHEPPISQSELPNLAEGKRKIDESICPAAQEELPKVSSAKSTKVS